MLEIWTVYERPQDYPGHYVARKFLMSDGSAVATADAHFALSLDRLREKLPPGLLCLTRSPFDPPNIVECWL